MRRLFALVVLFTLCHVGYTQQQTGTIDKDKFTYRASSTSTGTWDDMDFLAAHSPGLDTLWMTLTPTAKSIEGIWDEKYSAEKPVIIYESKEYIEALRRKPRYKPVEKL